MIIAPDLTLAMDTSGDVCSVALLKAGRLVSEQVFRHEMHLSERLLDHVTSVLKDADASMDQIDLLAVGLGPGSFTGVRIGVMTMKTFADILQKPIYGVDSLCASAAHFRGLSGLLVAPMHPCRTGMVYTGLYDPAGETPVTVMAADALTIEALVAALTACEYAGTYVFCGPASERYREDVLTALGDRSSCAVFNNEIVPLASRVGQIALAMQAGGAPPDDALSLVPQYVSPPPITMPKGAAP